MGSEESKLRWQCRRGVKELDIVLERFLKDYYQQADKQAQQAFKELLALEDPVLLTMLIENKNSDKPSQQAILEQLKSLLRN